MRSLPATPQQPKTKTAIPAADAYIFDIDGTLLVTNDLVHWNALHQAMVEAYGVNTTIDGIPYHGKTDLSILRAAVGRAGISDFDFDAKLPAALQVVCREVEANHLQLAAKICPGIAKLLESLKASGKLIGVASGNLESVGWHKIEAAGLRHFFTFGFFSDNHESRGAIFRNAVEHVNVQLGPAARVCFIGDTPSDVEAARQAGAQILAVASGTFSLEELTACSPDMCVWHCGEFFPD
jgi:phosphoglycolate phosphatase-like HAD superfamily hydrolase